MTEKKRELCRQEAALRSDGARPWSRGDVDGSPAPSHTFSQRGAMQPAVAMALLLLILPGCAEGPFVPVAQTEEREIRATLAGRSFRQFDPSKDASPRKSVIIEFFNGVGLWAQYAEGGRALDEWEIVASDYRIEQAGDGSIVRIHFASPRSERRFPAACTDCVGSSGVSVAIRDVFDADRVRFRVDDLQHRLPSPFPVFRSWTRFEEDIYYD